jgi:hypothetical protein
MNEQQGQQLSINPQTLINELQNRLSASQNENVILSAMLQDLQSALEAAQEEETTEDASD